MGRDCLSSTPWFARVPGRGWLNSPCGQTRPFHPHTPPSSPSPPGIPCPPSFPHPPKDGIVTYTEGDIDDDGTDKVVINVLDTC